MINILKLFYLSFISIICGLLGAYAGAENTSKNWRRIGIPAIITLYALYSLHNLYIISIMFMCIALGIGYGIPSPTDKGSFLGKFFMKIFKNNSLYSNMAVRGSIGLLISLSLISVILIKHNWICYLWCSFTIIMVNSIISWKDLGQFNLFNKKLNFSDFITWGMISMLSYLIVHNK